MCHATLERFCVYQCKSEQLSFQDVNQEVGEAVVQTHAMTSPDLHTGAKLSHPDDCDKMFSQLTSAIF